MNTFNWLSDANPILPDHSLREDLELDSLGMVNLQVAIEDEFDIRFDPVETDLTEVFETVESLAEFIQKYTQENESSI
jgi:acyl carrier protein